MDGPKRKLVIQGGGRPNGNASQLMPQDGDATGRLEATRHDEAEVSI